MTTFWIILVILFLVYLNITKVRETVNSFFKKSNRGGFNKGGFDSKKSKTCNSDSSSSRSSGRNYEKYNHSQSSQYGSLNE